MHKKSLTYHHHDGADGEIQARVLEALLEEAENLPCEATEIALARACDALVRVCPAARFASWHREDKTAGLLRPQYAAGTMAHAAQTLHAARLGRREAALCHPMPRAACARLIGIDASELAHWRTEGLAARVQSVISLDFRSSLGCEGGLIILGAGDNHFFEKGGVAAVLAFARLIEKSLAQVGANRQLADAASRDPLTGLYNRRRFLDVASAQHASSVACGQNYSVIIFDVDQLKYINEEYGYETGDALLKSLGSRIRELLAEDTTVARWSGEEFIALLPRTNETEAAFAAERLRQAIHDQPILNLLAGTVGVSAGVATSADRSALEHTIARATARLAQTRSPGPGASERRGQTRGDLYLLAQVRSALQTGRIRPAYQPIVDLATGAIVAEEALARLISSDGTKESPAGEFIETVTRFDLVHEIDAAIMRETLERCTAQYNAGTVRLHFVNMSAAFLKRPDFVGEVFGFIQEQCRSCGRDVTDPKPMVIEITEREFVQDTAAALAVLQPLLDLGLRLAIDDFGSGYSSFRYLVDLPVSFVKLEGELVRKIVHDRKARAVIQSMQRLADDLGLITVAEYVENEASRQILRDMGVRWGQGYLFGRPCVERPALRTSV